MFADMIVIVEGIVTVVEQRYDLYSWYMLLVDGGSRICNQIYLIPRVFSSHCGYLQICYSALVTFWREKLAWVT